ncbi:MAG: glycosyltransferase family 4 protein [candidate division Zixibacteria bacterium]|nr:glycosyltransferase family 4 protein [candidate division Zixibacteria bacterium]
MKKVLIISYYFPPMGMGGVQRALKFAKYLPSFGWQPIILTVKDVDYFAKDYTLLDELPSDVKIIRTGSLDPLRLSYLLKRITRKTKESQGETYTPLKAKILSWFFFPDNKIGWFPFALVKGINICKKEKVDLILSTSPPPSCHLIGYVLKRLCGKPWVADFRDLWFGPQYEFFPTPLHTAARKIIEKTISKNADAIVTVNHKITEYIQGYSPKTIETIFNGYDREDFNFEIKKPTDRFTILHFGTFGPGLNPEPFFKALSNLIRKKLINSNNIKFIKTGQTIGLNLQSLLDKYNLKDITQTLGYVSSHKGALQILAQADLLLLITSLSPQSKYVTPGKVYEYLAANRPILAIVPEDSSAAQIIQFTQTGKVISPDRIEEIEKAILDYYQNYLEKRSGLKPNRAEINKFERKYLTSKLATLFDRTIQLSC